MSFVDRLKNSWDAYCLERKARMVEGFEPRMLEELKLQPGSKEARMVSEENGTKKSHKLCRISTIAFQGI